MPSLKPRISTAVLAVAAAVAITTPATAKDTGAHPPYAMTVYEVVRAPGGMVDPAVIAADLGYVSGMREHHAGALTMSQEYLEKGSHPALRALSRAIIANQEFEIALLDDVRAQVETPARPLVGSLALRPTAREDLRHRLNYLPSPPPTTHAVSRAPVSEYDVQWAKAMIVHHQGALEMAAGYNADPAARNGVLRLLNLDIIQDQSYEIAWLESLIDRYPGDAAAIQLDPGMVHGMPMGGGHDGHGAHSGHNAPTAPSGHAGHAHH